MLNVGGGMMESIIEIASRVSTPLAFGGLLIRRMV